MRLVGEGNRPGNSIEVWEEGSEYGSSPSNESRTPSLTARRVRRIHQPLGNNVDQHDWNKHSTAPRNKLWTGLEFEFRSEMWSRLSSSLRCSCHVGSFGESPNDVVFRTFPRKKKSATTGRQSTANVQSHCQPSTGAARGAPGSWRLADGRGWVPAAPVGIRDGPCGRFEVPNLLHELTLVWALLGVFGFGLVGLLFFCMLVLFAVEI